ncbi:S-formylglutathione hydrolase FrmB [Kribbella aluminosa]|uniref:Acyl-CoA:diacylglycerol acyltransferase n=1 Tax=Kribbella aluminosa TaxID=416017 RepID=A0ABS4UUE6_9ACTN|nr:alpha/beta hydrolase-fold protein [Kribbella aluminosa]MBP2355245.1 S-formylglutathione hydrolase FrmB [Kribbella aluminosa]
MLTRRTFVRAGGAAAVAGVAGVAALETGTVPGRGRVHQLLGLTGPDGVVPDVPAGPVVSGTFASRARRTDVGYSVIYPDGYDATAELPVVLALHGRGGDHTSAINDLGMDRFLTATVRAGTPAFALASVDGGRDSYWHRRANGNDPGFMIAQEFLPLLAGRGLRIARYGVFGWSMGGYGALLWVALHYWQRQVGPAARAVAVGALSPALWHRYEDAQPGAFDDAADFESNQLFGRPNGFRDVAARIDCGRDDPFAAAARDLRTELDADGGQQPGLHTGGYWRRMLPDQLRFLGAKLGG